MSPWNVPFGLNHFPGDAWALPATPQLGLFRLGPSVCAHPELAGPSGLGPYPAGCPCRAGWTLWAKPPDGAPQVGKPPSFVKTLANSSISSNTFENNPPLPYLTVLLGAWN